MHMLNPEQQPESALLDQLQGFRDGRYERISGAELARRLTFQRPDSRILRMRRQRKGPKPDGVEATSLVENPGSAVTLGGQAGALSAEDAYAMEWRNYDSFGGRHGLDNDVQPILAVG
jgi:hypothetical protein